MSTDTVTPGNALPPEVYPSKLDRWFVGMWRLVWVSILSIPASVFWPPLSDDVPFIIGLASLLLFVIAYDLWAVRNTYYELEGEHLLIRYGSTRRRTLYSDVVEVRPSRQFVRWGRSLVALSPDCLFIRHRRWDSHLWISLEDKEAFMRDLASRAPNLTFQGGRVIRIDKAGPSTTQQNS